MNNFKSLFKNLPNLSAAASSPKKKNTPWNIGFIVSFSFSFSFTQKTIHKEHINEQEKE